ncbi:hypothetical protein, variant [Verruconis gallopava]|uniref:C2H2-type domain-containing protein n=1 Tax=Verruconis gallopava TaxID=253628 RepID=A0A0D1Z5A4_9PEZI|nr:hypothetical protein, variant [Verruconis gallopava]KIW08162.1 hypothetical protein, variant [Verruconis gallopava]
MSTGFTSSTPAQPTSPSSPGAKLAFHLQNGHTQHMDGRQTEYPQSDQASAAQYSQGQDPRSANFSSSATPTSEYGLPPSSARSGSFPEYIQRQHYPPAGQGTQAGGMAQATNPSIAAASPTYPPPHQPYSPYQAQHEMGHYSTGHPGVYGRPDWAGGQYQTPPHMGHYGATSSGPPTPSMVSPVQRPPTGGHPLSTVYSFVPIPGAQQHKRPRRRYEEIERMYKCGWNGCEKAYGTLNHLNAHVTMQSHGPKRTPEEFKEIRKEWKAKKKEEEAQRKAEEERQRQADPRSTEQHDQNAQYGQMRTTLGPPPNMGGPQLPPIGYPPQQGGPPSQPQYGQPQPSPGMDSMGHYPQSPYGQSNQVYQQR